MGVVPAVAILVVVVANINTVEIDVLFVAQLLFVVNSLSPNIHMNILLTVFHIFLSF